MRTSTTTTSTSRHLRGPLVAIALVTLVTIVTLIPLADSRAPRRCYVCRSRGVLGDCRDPFWYNSTLLTSPASKGIEPAPCPSGWCGKAVEGKADDHTAATERICLQRPPIDGVERCSETFHENKRRPVFMCFCKGDLCNGKRELRSWSGVSGLLTLLVAWLMS